MIKSGLRLAGRILLYFVVLHTPLACSNESRPGGEITIKNDILDKEYNSFTVDKLVTGKGLSSYRISLKPGQSVILPFSGIREMRFSRRYDDHSKVYEVTCPSSFDRVMTIKLIDVHTNKMSGGCELSRRGTMSLGGLVKWE